MRETRRVKNLGRVSTLLFSGVALAASSAATPPKATTPAVHRSEAFAEERREGDARVNRTVSVRLDFVDVSLAGRGGNAERVLLAQRFDVTRRDDREGEEARLELTAYRTGAKPYDIVAWTRSLEASAGRVDGPLGLYEAKTRGCCGAEDLKRLVALASGREVAAYTGEPATVAGEERAARVVGYHSMMAARELPERAKRKNAIGALTLSSAEGPLARLLVLREKVEDFGTPRITLLRRSAPGGGAPSLATSDAKAGYRVRLEWDEALVAVIPVRGDAFQPAEATLPAGFSLVSAAVGAPSR